MVRVGQIIKKAKKEEVGGAGNAQVLNWMGLGQLEKRGEIT